MKFSDELFLTRFCLPGMLSCPPPPIINASTHTCPSGSNDVV